MYAKFYDNQPMVYIINQKFWKSELESINICISNSVLKFRVKKWYFCNITQFEKGYIFSFS